MSKFIRMLERLISRRSEGRGMSVLHDGRNSPDEIEALARMTAQAIQSETKFAPLGEKLNFVTTMDFDGKGNLTAAARKRIKE